MYNGLNNQEVLERINNKQINHDNIKYTRKLSDIIFSNVFTIFNVIHIVLFILVLITKSYQNALFISIIIINTVIFVASEIKAKMTLDNLKLSTQTKYKVIRNNEETLIDKNQIVLDDLLILKSGDQLPVDIIVISSNLCEVDESLITGESNSIVKRKNDTIYSGTTIISGSCKAKVISVSEKNYTNTLIKEASTITNNKTYLQESLNRILKVVTYLIIPVGLLLFITQYFFSHNTINEAILSSVAGVLGMIPEGLILLTSISLTYGVIKIAKKNAIVQRLNGIEMLSYMDILCFDKTNTITDGTMKVEEVITIDKNHCINEIIPNMLSDILINQTDIALSEYFTTKVKYNLVKYIPFSSIRKFTSSSFENIGTYSLGALEYIVNRPEEYYQYIDSYIKEGKRVLTLTFSRDIPENNNVPLNSKVVGFIVIKENVRENAKETIKYFAEQDVELKIISGDNPISVSAVAKSIGFKNYQKYIDLSQIEETDLEEISHKYSIFGRATPQQKRQIIKYLKTSAKVGMIGDGINDILALKEADCGIAILSGAEAAKNVSDIIITDSNFDVIPSIVNEGRRVVNNIEKVASLFLVKTTYSFLISIICIIMQEQYPFYPIHLTLISAFCVGIPSFFLALFPNYKKTTKTFLKNVFRNAIPSGITVALNVLYIMLICKIFKLDYDFYRFSIFLVTGMITLLLLYRITKKDSKLGLIIAILSIILFFASTIIGYDLLLLPEFKLTNIYITIILFIIDIILIKWITKLYNHFYR